MNNWLAAVGLMRVIEGVLPFAALAVRREGFRRMQELSDGQLRFIGAAKGRANAYFAGVEYAFVRPL